MILLYRLFKDTSRFTRFLLKNPYRFISFLLEYRKFKKLCTRSNHRFSIPWFERYPCLDERTLTTEFNNHYIYHPAWAARILAKTRPEYHTDISSLLDFSSLVSAFIPIKFYDYRPANVRLNNLSSEQADLTHLPFPDDSIHSLSCMHTVEHVGLGRYGDPLDPDGDLKAIAELKRVTTKGGTLLFVVPIGRKRIQFNAHRIYCYEQIIEYFDGFELKEFALIPDELKDGIIINASSQLANSQNYGCGCFWFIKNNK